MFVLYDSRQRVRTGRRTAYVYAEMQASVRHIWDLVIAVEVPDERDAYDYLGDTPAYDAVEVFNDFWGCYGWYLNVYEDDTGHFPEDIDVITPVVITTTKE
jgi:hypothetical protein